MPAEDNPIYPKWRAAVARVMAAKEAIIKARSRTPARTAAEGEYLQAMIDYEIVARQM
jgi:hypothetical protein